MDESNKYMVDGTSFREDEGEEGEEVEEDEEVEEEGERDASTFKFHCLFGVDY